jgi:hypothetical protein
MPVGRRSIYAGFVVHAATALLLLSAVIPGRAAPRNGRTEARSHCVPPAASVAPAIPRNWIVPGVVRSLILTMLQQSPTFRRQCARLSEYPDLVVDIELVVRLPEYHAQSVLERNGSGRRATVQIELRRPALYVEYIAHELEHVLEYLDGTDLPRLARNGVDGVVKAGDWYETTRAQSIGCAVAREVSSR